MLGETSIFIKHYFAKWIVSTCISASIRHKRNKTNGAQLFLLALIQCYCRNNLLVMLLQQYYCIDYCLIYSLSDSNSAVLLYSLPCKAPGKTSSYEVVIYYSYNLLGQGEDK